MTSSYLYQLIICAIFLLILWIISKIVSKKGFSIKKNTDSKIQIIDKQYIERNATLVMVKVEDEILLLGVTSQQVNLIKKIDKKEML